MASPERASKERGPECYLPVNDIIGYADLGWLHSEKRTYRDLSNSGWGGGPHRRFVRVSRKRGNSRFSLEQLEFINMSYFRDLSPYSFIKMQFTPNVVNVGWLDAQHQYRQQKADP